MKCLYQIADYDVHVFKMPVIDSNMYMIIDKNQALVIDPCISEEAESILLSNNTQFCTILLTHEHYDHISGVNRLRELCPCEVICSEACAKNICNCLKNGAKTFGALFLGHSKEEQKDIDKLWDPYYICSSDKIYKDKYIFTVFDGALKIEMQEAPGHSQGSQIIKMNDNFIFTGDSLIPKIETITRLPGGSRKIYEEKTLPIIKALDDNSVIFPGHDSVCTMQNAL